MCLKGVGRTFENCLYVIDSVKKNVVLGEIDFCFIRDLNRWQFGQNLHFTILKCLLCLKFMVNFAFINCSNSNLLPWQLRSHAI